MLRATSFKKNANAPGNVYGAMLRATSMALLFAIVSSQCGPEQKEAFPPGQTACPPANGPPGGGEAGATTDYTKGAPLAAPLRGKVGTVEML